MIYEYPVGSADPDGDACDQCLCMGCYADADEPCRCAPAERSS